MSFILCGPILLMILVAQATSTEASFAYECHENSEEKIAANSVYEANLNLALSNLIQTSSLKLKANQGFYKSSQGQNPDKVNVLGLCRGDVEPEICHTCLNKTSHRLTELCPDEREAIGGFDECVLQYSNRSSTGHVEPYPRAYTWSNHSSSTNYTDGFLLSLEKLFRDLRNKASNGGPLGEYSSEQIRTGLGSFDTIYAAAQCRPDLSKIDCEMCLDEIFVDIRRFEGVLGWRVITSSCNFRFESYLFFGLVYSPPPPEPVTDTTSIQAKKKSGGLGAGGLAVSAATVVLIISVGVYTRVKKTYTAVENDASSMATEEIGCVANLKFDFRTIKAATRNFSDQEKIGQSSVGVVYKGKLRQGRLIAVKCVNSRLHRFYVRNEILCGSKLFHRNLVKLIGFCSKGDNSYLIYEYLPWKLDQYLLQDLKVDWGIRFKIINGIARALLYLHEDSGLKIAHGDIKSSKILFDRELNPKISCFGNAYIWKPDIRSDVFAFGVLILEIITRKRSKDHTNRFIDYVRRNWRSETILNVVDVELRGISEIASIIRCIHIALLCVGEAADSRPTMNSVVLMLNHDSLILPDLPESIEPLLSLTESEPLSWSNSLVSAQENLPPISEINDRKIVSGRFSHLVAWFRQLPSRGVAFSLQRSSFWHTENYIHRTREIR